MSIELDVVGSDGPALVDNQWSHLRQYRWSLDKYGYVNRRAGGQRIYLHQVVLSGNRYPAFVRDHINRDKLDNRLCNLRWLTLAESAQNKGAYQRKHCLGLRGVMPIGQKYRATGTIAGVVHRLGYFADPYAAASAAATWRRAYLPCSVEE